MSTALVQRTVSFYGDDLVVIRQGEIAYTPLKPICEAFGLDWKSQYRRALNDEVLGEGMVIMTIPSAGGPQQMACLPIDYLHGWFFGVQVGRIRPELRERLVLYKRECYRVLAQAFIPKSQSVPLLGTPELPRLEAYKPKHVEAAQQVEELIRRIPECMEFTGDEGDRIEPYDLARGLGNRGVKLPYIGEFRGYLLIERALEILGVKRSYYLVAARRGFRKSSEYFWYGVRWAPVKGRLNWEDSRRA